MLTRFWVNIQSTQNWSNWPGFPGQGFWPGSPGHFLTRISGHCLTIFLVKIYINWVKMTRFIGSKWPILDYLKFCKIGSKLVTGKSSGQSHWRTVNSNQRSWWYCSLHGISVFTNQLASNYMFCWASELWCGTPTWRPRRCRNSDAGHQHGSHDVGHQHGGCDVKWKHYNQIWLTWLLWPLLYTTAPCIPCIPQSTC